MPGAPGNLQRAEQRVDSLISCMNTPLWEGPTHGQGKELLFILAGAAGRLPADLPFPGAAGRKYLEKKA